MSSKLPQWALPHRIYARIGSYLINNPLENPMPEHVQKPHFVSRVSMLVEPKRRQAMARSHLKRDKGRPCSFSCFAVGGVQIFFKACALLFLF